VAAAPQKDGDKGRPSISDDSSATDGEWGMPAEAHQPGGGQQQQTQRSAGLRRVTQCVLENIAWSPEGTSADFCFDPKQPFKADVGMAIFDTSAVL